MPADVGPAAQQGIVSTQVQTVQNDRPTAAERPQATETQQAPPPPPPPPADSGRGTNIDTTA